MAIKAQPATTFPPPARLRWPGGAFKKTTARVARTFAVSTAIAFGMWLQFLAQLFVWRNWPVGGGI